MTEIVKQTFMGWAVKLKIVKLISLTVDSSDFIVVVK